MMSPCLYSFLVGVVGLAGRRILLQHRVDLLLHFDSHLLRHGERYDREQMKFYGEDVGIP